MSFQIKITLIWKMFCIWIGVFGMLEYLDLLRVSLNHYSYKLYREFKSELPENLTSLLLTGNSVPYGQCVRVVSLTERRLYFRMPPFSMHSFCSSKIAFKSNSHYRHFFVVISSPSRLFSTWIFHVSVCKSSLDPQKAL